MPTGFASETATVTGDAKETINKYLARAAALAPDVLESMQDMDITVADIIVMRVGLQSRSVVDARTTTGAM